MPVSHTGLPARSAKPLGLLGLICNPGLPRPLVSSSGGSMGGSSSISSPRSDELEPFSSGSSAAHAVETKVRHASRRAGFVIFVLLAHCGQRGALHRPYHSRDDD